MLLGRRSSSAAEEDGEAHHDVLEVLPPGSSSAAVVIPVACGSGSLAAIGDLARRGHLLLSTLQRHGGGGMALMAAFGRAVRLGSSAIGFFGSIPSIVSFI